MTVDSRYGIERERHRGATALASLVASMALAACVGEAGFEHRYGAEPIAVAFVDVAVVHPGRTEVLQHQTVVARHGRIEAVGPVAVVTPPAGALVVQASGRYLMPGMMDAHVHHFEPDRGYYERELLLYLAHGVTSVRIMNGTDRALRARDRIRAGELTGPRLVVCSPQIGRSYGGSHPDSARAFVRRMAMQGYDCVKIYSGPKPDAFAAAIVTADSIGIPTAGHASTRLPFEAILRLGSIEHVEEIQWFFGRRPELSDAVDGPRVDSLAQFGGPVVPTIGGFDFRVYLDEKEYARLRGGEPTHYVPVSWLRESDSELAKRRKAGQNIDSLRRSFGDMYERALRYTNFFHTRGVRLVMGTDAGNLLFVPGFAESMELAEMVKAGLTPTEALASATESAAELLRIQGGRIEPGRVSDLVLLRANPLLDIANVTAIEGVMAGSRWLDSPAIEAILRNLRKREASSMYKY